jgi:hypothetical protein
VQIRHLFFRGGAAAVLALGLSACQNMDKAVQPGAAYTDVLARYGRPTVVCPLPDGGQRAVWSAQPMGAYAWGSDITPDGHVVRMESLLTDKNFSKIRPGWTPEQLRCEFGPPAFIDAAGLYEMREVVWNYHYPQDDIWNALMYVYMGPKGDHVTHFNPGPIISR